jgi:tetratricopeptide (TPR) repeat protein
MALRLFIMLSVGVWFWGAAGCAPLPPPAPPEAELPEMAGCVPSQLEQELEQLKSALGGAPRERVNHLIRLGRLCFLLGHLSPRAQKPDFFRQGRDFAETLVREQPDWVEGHYWLALNLCGLAEIGGAKQGWSLLPRILEELERALEVNPGYDQGGPPRVLGRIYYEAPPWPISVGDIHQSYKYLAQAAALAPDNSTNHLYLAQTLWKLGKKAEARRELEAALRAPRHALCPRDHEEDRREALRLLREYR